MNIIRLNRSQCFAAMVLTCLLTWPAQSQAKELDPRLLVPLIEANDQDAVVRLVGGPYKIRKISDKAVLLPLNFNQVQARLEGVVLFDLAGGTFPILNTTAPDLKKLMDVRTLREVLDLMCGSKNESSEIRKLFCKYCNLDFVTGVLNAGEPIKFQANAAYVSGKRIQLVSFICNFGFVIAKGSGIDTPIHESTVSISLSPEFLVEEKKP